MEKIYRLIGLAHKAGKVSQGHMGVKKSIMQNRAYLVVICEDSSPRTAKELVRVCTGKNIPWVISGTKEELGGSLGKSDRAAVTVDDRELAGAVLREMAELKGREKSMGVMEWPKSECMN